MLQPENNMLKAYAQIIGSDEGSTVLVAERKSACESCAAAKGCGVSSLSKILSAKMLRFQTRDISSPRQGDWYVIGMPHHALLKMAATIYMVPLFFMIVMAIIAANLGAGDIGVATVSIGGLVLGYWCVRRLVAGSQLNRLANPVILGRASAAFGARNDDCHVSG